MALANWLRECGRRLRMLFGRGRFDREMDEEMRLHLEMREKELREKAPRGSDPAAERAYTEARKNFGNALVMREASHEAWGWTWLEHLMQDLRYGLSMLRKSPGFTAITILTLALGIGANTAIFSLIHAVMLQSLPVKNPQQLVLFQWDSNKWPPMFHVTGWPEYLFSYPEYKDFQAQEKTLSGMFAFVPLGFNAENTTVGINGEPTLADGMMVTGQYFSTLGVTPLLGRSITDADEEQGAPRVTVISYAYWARRFARNPSIIGKNVTLNSIPFSIVGVTPRSFYGVEVGTEPDLWVPFDDRTNMRPWSLAPGDGTGSVYAARNWLCIYVMGRLANGATKAQAQSALDTNFHQFVTAEWHPEKDSDIPRFTLAAGNQGLPMFQQGFGQPLEMLMVAVGLVLLIACANVATLLLARSATREKEISARLALGASRWRLIRQLLTESVLMSLLGGLLGLLLANWSTEALIALISNTYNATIVLHAGADARVLLFMFVVAVLTGILFGLAPALRALRIELASAMRDTANTSHVHDKHHFGQSLIIAQVATSLVLMIGAGLFIRTLVNYENRNFGFDQRDLLSFGLDPTRAGYHDARVVTLYSQLLDRIQALPGVRAATLMAYSPFSNLSNYDDVSVEGATKDFSGSVYWQPVGPDFFRTMGIPIILGRGIQGTDIAASPQVAVVDEAFARKFFPGQSPVGHRFSFTGKFGPEDSYEIVGVSRSAELTDPQAQPMPAAYMAYAQSGAGEMFFEVRSEGTPGTIVSELRDAVHQTDPSLPLIDLKTQAEETRDGLAFPRLFTSLTSIFGLLALILAMIGLYGTMAYSVKRKTREIGIRMALGANPTDVLGMVMWQGLALTLVGIVIGVVTALGVARLVTSMIFGVTPYDPATFMGVVAILILVAAVACYIPARRAMRVDPMVALRYE